MPFLFYIDGRPYSSEKAQLTSAEIRQMAFIPANYQLCRSRRWPSYEVVEDGASVALDSASSPFYFFSAPAVSAET